METKELRKGGEACQEVSRALTFMLCDEIPLKIKPTPTPPCILVLVRNRF
jgi:hypothetical protein